TPAGLNQLLLLAIERALSPPLVHRRMLFQPMSIVVVDPALLSQASAGDRSQFEMPNVLPRALPPATDGPHFVSSQFQHRTIRGEILSDEGGHLNKKLVRQIRPIHQLASGQFGEVIDLVPATSSRPGILTAPSGPTVFQIPTPFNAQSAVGEPVVENDGSGKSSFMPAQQTSQQNQQQTTTVSHRKLFADPGQWRVLWWGEFKEILAPQLAHPERLKDN